MYRPTAFQEDNVDKLVSFMRTNSFATLVSIVDGVPCASHIPLVVTLQEDVVKLSGHLAKQNPQWQAFDTAESLAIFTGAHAYISPTLYEKHESVPTWNYIAVHAYGIPKIMTFNNTPQSVDKMINDMIDTYEAEYKLHWHGLSDGFREGMMNGIVGFEMTVTRLEGKYKLSQNRSQTDQQNVSKELLKSSDAATRAIGTQMKQNIEKNE
ncbi:negative transcriptional regulator, PaiB family [Gloeocapsa sp. PCC 7428]|uniref:FMN-binding negative transcriptional regulator n=1 Tax=Gloeocapsa sp. PCC 7428 TaxID=1173026 RepID=UPI0002A6029D|nr:FMN-binding negative transcriptional regulator [Gloeocapsa sp. PCC 7428]AFZ32512.1 negative transcriptional regulator, PaiB family [Gloeocapsa sp. PCC 7428]